MAHDPISLIFRGSTEVSEVLVVPRIQGIVKGSEVLAQEGNVPYIGDIIFKDDVMVIKLIYDYPHRESSPSWWDGKYILRKE